MSSTNDVSAETLLVNAIEIASPAERSAYLEARCGNDLELLRQVESMVVDYFAAESLMEPPVELELTSDVGRALATPPLSVVQIGNYKLREPIGEGGMGVVYVADQVAPIRRRVALKVIKPGLDSKQVVARFESERQALALMDHPNIARVFDGGTTEDGRPYFVMELVKGVAINDFCESRDLDLAAKLELFIDVCGAVEHAHKKGIIHRDLKPSNLLVTMHDDKPVAKVIDFGIAKATTQPLIDSTVYTGFAQLIGTPAYMSPEQVEMNNLDVDTRSDVYSLGVVLYELLTGSLPFDRQTLKEASFDELRQLIRESAPPRPSQRISTLAAKAESTFHDRRRVDPRKLADSLKREVDWIVLKALEKDRNRRYQSARDFADDIRRYLNDEPVKACPPSASYRLRKTAKRHRLALITGAMIFSVLIIGAGVSVWQARQAVAERKMANEEKEKANASFDRALAAVETMLERVATDKLVDVPEMTAVRRELYAEAIQFYADLAEERPQEPRIRLNLARTQRQTAVLCGQQSQFQTGLALVGPSIATLKSLVSAHPGNAEYQSSLGASLVVSSDLNIDLRHFDQAVLESRAAADVFTRISDRPGLGSALSRLGSCYFRQGVDNAANLLEGEYWLRQALPLCEAAYTDDHKHWLALCSTNLILGQTHTRLGKPQESLAFANAALDVATATIAEGRDLSFCLVYSFMIRDELANAYNAMGDAEKSMQTHQLGLLESRDFFTRFPRLNYKNFHSKENATAVVRLSKQLERTDELHEFIARLDSHSLVDVYIRASMFQVLGDDERAIADFEWLATKDPRRKSATNWVISTSTGMNTTKRSRT